MTTPTPLHSCKFVTVKTMSGTTCHSACLIHTDARGALHIQTSPTEWTILSPWHWREIHITTGPTPEWQT